MSVAIQEAEMREAIPNAPARGRLRKVVTSLMRREVVGFEVEVKSHVATHAKVTSGTVGSSPGKSHQIGASRGKLTLLQRATSAQRRGDLSQCD